MLRFFSNLPKSYLIKINVFSLYFTDNFWYAVVPFWKNEDINSHIWYVKIFSGDLYFGPSDKTIMILKSKTIWYVSFFLLLDLEKEH